MDDKSEAYKIEQEKREQGRKTTLTQHIVYSIIIYFFIIILFSMVQITE